MILDQVKSAVARLNEEERNDVHVVAVTLDPENDNVEAMRKYAEGQEVSAPAFNLLTGEPEEVNDVLDHMGIERHRNPDNGVIDHTNLFLVMDRAGRVAYRFSLGDLQEDWLVKAVKLLVTEPEPSS